MISKIRYYVNETCLLNMYHSFVQSHINYNILNWTCTNPSFIKPIETKVKKAIRIISFAKTKYDHTLPLFKHHKILPLHDQIELNKASFMWKISNGHVPPTINNLFTVNLFDPQKFNLPHPRIEHDKILLGYSCVKTWNTIPTNFKNLSFKTFTKKYKEYLINNI